MRRERVLGVLGRMDDLLEKVLKKLDEVFFVEKLLIPFALLLSLIIMVGAYQQVVYPKISNHWIGHAAPIFIILVFLYWMVKRMVLSNRDSK